MTELISKSQRDKANIDRLDKAFLWAVLLLRQSILSSNNQNNSGNNTNPYKDWVSVGHNLYGNVSNERNPIVFVKAKLAYNSQTFLLKGGNFIESLSSMTNLSSLLFNSAFLKSIAQNITKEPNAINSLEKYVYWLSLQLINEQYSTSKNIQISINEENYPNNYFQIEATFNLITSSFFSGLPWVDCLSAIDVTSILTTGTALNNSTPLGNLSTIGN
jgi:hypothetical protein